MEMKELIENLVKRLADEPDGIEIKEEQRKDGTLCFVAYGIAKPDMGKVIGRKGQNIQSIRTIVVACGAKQDKKFSFDLPKDA